MYLHSVNVGQAREISFRGQAVSTGIYKEPVTGPVRVERETLAGDRQVDLRFHGGVDKAVYCYAQEHYAYWAEALGRGDLQPGAFGENFTTVGLNEETLGIGDTLAIGNAVFQVTQPRVPCFKLGVKFGSAGFVKQFMNAQRTGWYLRVLREGTVAAGMPIEHMPYVSERGQRLTLAQVNRLHFFEPDDHAGLREALENPHLSQSWREELHALLPPTGTA